MPILFLFLGFCFCSCAPDFAGEYADPKSMEIIDDRWNEFDARKVSHDLISSALSSSWLNEFFLKEGKKPVVVVGFLENRTDEHLDTESLVEAIQYEFLQSQKVRFVASKEREALLKELNYQHSGKVNPSEMKLKGRQVGADFLLTGSLSSQVHSYKGLKTVTYQVILSLIHLETSEMIWTGKQDIKKRFQRSSWSW